MTAILASWFTEIDPQGQRVLLNAMPLMLGVLCILALAYRYYSAFLAARVAVLDDSRVTPAHRFNDGQNYYPTHRWVLFGHHFAAISGAGPLIGPVLALQYGYAPGLLWLVIGVCLAGAVQDMLVLAASVRHDGKSLAEIARIQLGKPAAIIVSLAILFIVVIALAGLGFVVVKALGGEQVKLPAGMQITLPEATKLETIANPATPDRFRYQLPPGCTIRYTTQSMPIERPEAFQIVTPAKLTLDAAGSVRLPGESRQLIPGSSWGTFTIAATIPIALLVGLWMYRIRKGRIVEASVLGAVAVIGATVAGAWVPGSSWERFFSLSREETILALCGYGFVASVLPVWLLLGPRDYLSSFLKIGTLILLVLGVLVANPTLKCPALNQTFLDGGPTFAGSIFPFVFICIMCGAISGFHALVSSGTTPKMIERERDIRPIGYGAMLIEGLVGLVALITAAALPPELYYDINVDLDKAPQYQQQLQEMYTRLGVQDPAAADPMHRAGIHDLHTLNLAQMEEMVGGESLRGRTGGAVTLAVGMATILTDAFRWTELNIASLMKYWYHFAIMFEALFILTTIDAGTRIGRFLLQELLGKAHQPFERTDWLPGSVLTTLVITLGWGALIYTGEISTIWPMFGIANQLLAVLALALVTTWLVNTGRGRFAPLTILPMLFVVSTTMTAGAEMIGYQFPALIRRGEVFKGWLNIVMAMFVIVSVMTLLLMAVTRWLAVWIGGVAVRPDSRSAEDGA